MSKRLARVAIGCVWFVWMFCGVVALEIINPPWSLAGYGMAYVIWHIIGAFVWAKLLGE